MSAHHTLDNPIAQLMRRNKVLLKLIAKDAPMFLSALGYFAPAHRHSIPAAPSQPACSPYDPPKDLKPGVYNFKMHRLHTDGDIKISREITWDPTSPDGPKIQNNRIVVETGDSADEVHVRKRSEGQIQILVNGKSYLFDAKVEKGPPQGLWIKTNAGNDKVTIDDDLKLRVDVDAGDGDDRIQAGGGRSRLYGGKGNDVLRLGSGLGYAEGNEGNDLLIGGSGNAVMYGNDGNDRLFAGAGTAAKQSYLDGGNGNDQLYAGNGHTVLHGGNDDDQLVGHDRTTFYTGKGKDRVWRNKASDLVYAKPSDRFNRHQGSMFTPVAPSNAGKQGFEVKGDDAFKQRVEDDFEFMRSSPNGQKVLAEMDTLAGINGGKVTIAPISFGGTNYEFDSQELDDLNNKDESQIDASKYGEIKDGVAGSRANRATIYFDSPWIIEEQNGNTIVPVTSLYHEIVHAWNGATGTFLGGTSADDDASVKAEASDEERATANFEYQAIGVPNSGEPFDLDNDPSTVPTTTNPKPFTENALNEEMGKPPRKRHALHLSRQGGGL
ncbi:M91 family zinc metallopeptidase [Pseudomonas sp. HN11]|uniref:M91 family zinc metallopeptidase n=1 Tax=Pseudomonas sp. HN11 TaxID=1344094 RepID=UPI001F172DE8|nr:M91 family zinc metallopeptidase [Pseudomonas sp. HN11]UII74174.1 M91 family zinc metallopeptidase [Pseudomonas sp. HN11]